MSDMPFASPTSNLLLPIWTILQSRSIIFRLTDYEHMTYNVHRREQYGKTKMRRLVKEFPNTTFFKPRGIPLVELEEITLAFDEYEALRLADLEGLYQEDSALRMNISRPTFGRIIESAHKKVADALINGKAIRIEGGVVTMAQKRTFECSDCEHSWRSRSVRGDQQLVRSGGSNNLHRAESERGLGRGGRGMGCRRRRGNTTVSAKEKE